MRALSARPAFAMRALPNAGLVLAMVMPVDFAPKFLAACSASVPQPQPMSSISSPGPQHELAADEVHLVVLRLLEGLLVARRKKPAGVDHAVAEERLEEVVAAVVVLADDALVLRLRVDGHLGDHAREEQLRVIHRQLVGDEVVAGVEERVHVARDVERAVEVSLEERRHRDLPVRVLRSERGIVKDNVIGEFGHG